MKAPSDKPQSSLAAGFVFLTITSVGWGLNWPVMKHLLTELPPLSARGWSGLVGAVSLAALALARGEDMRVPRALWPRLVLLSLLTVGSWASLIALSLLWLRASEAAVIAASMPVWVSLLALLILHEHFSLAARAGAGDRHRRPCHPVRRGRV